MKKKRHNQLKHTKNLAFFGGANAQKLKLTVMFNFLTRTHRLMLGIEKKLQKKIVFAAPMAQLTP